VGFGMTEASKQFWIETLRELCGSADFCSETGELR